MYELSYLFHLIRDEYQCNDDIVIYIGYKQEEITKELETISSFKNIIVKFSGFIPYQTSHYDDVLGIMLASDNQYGKKISYQTGEIQ